MLIAHLQIKYKAKQPLSKRRVQRRCNRFDRLLYRVGGEVCVTGGGLHLRVAEELADHRQALT